MKTDEFLYQIKAFRSLTKNEFKELCAQTQETTFKKGQVIFKEGEPSELVWLVKTGWVYLIKHAYSNKPLILFTMSPREILCGVSAFDQEPYAADGIAATECTLLQIPSPLFVSFLSENPQFCREVLSICSNRIRKMAQKLGETIESVHYRIARFLTDSILDFGRTLPFTHREISQIIGARIETSIRAFRHLREKDLLHIKRSCIEIARPLELTKELERWLTKKPL